MHIPTDMVPLIQQIIDLRAMSATPLTKNDDCSEEAIIAAANWMEQQKKAAVKSPTKSPIKKKRKKSAYQCFCSATLNTMRASEPERLAKLEESKELWKFLGAEWQKTKLNDVAFRFYTDQANIINQKASVGFGNDEQVGTEESKEDLEKQWLRDELGDDYVKDETPEDHVEVEKVLAHCRRGQGELRYLIKFVGTKKPEWVDAKHCACDELIEAYLESKEEGKVVEDETPEDHVEVEKVLAHWEYEGRGIRYLIKFVGTKKPEWVDAEDCACNELVKEYWGRKNSRVNEHLYNY